MHWIVYAALLAAIFKNILSEINTNVSSPSISSYEDKSLKLLSRKKRFLVFPEGSSVQLVFCNQYHGYFQIGDIIWFGTTAALAWELPSDPEVYDMFRDRNKIYEATRRTDVIYYLDEDGKVVGSKEYKRKTNIVNPAFAKRSTDYKEYNKQGNTKYARKELHKIQEAKAIMDKIDTNKIEYLRRERQILYTKIESFFKTLGWSGKDCMMKILCWTTKKNKQGKFLEEIIKAIFKLPGVKVNSKDHNHYDDAQENNGDCTDLFPSCSHE